MDKKILFIFVFIFLVLSLTSCKHIEDTNGESNFNVETFTDADVLKSSSSYTALNMITNKNSREVSMSVSKFSGIYKLDSFYLKNDNVSLTFDISCSEGNLRVVLIKDNKEITDIDINSTQEISLLNASGNYVIKVLGESAKFTFKCIKN